MGTLPSKRIVLIIKLISVVFLTTFITFLSKILNPNLYVTHGWLILAIIQVISLLRIVLKKNREEAISHLLTGYIICLSVSLVSGLIIFMGIFDFLCTSVKTASVLLLKPLSFILWLLIYSSFFILVIASSLVFYVISKDYGLLIPPIAKVFLYERIRRIPFSIMFFLSFLITIVTHHIIEIPEEHLKLVVFVILGLFMNLEASTSLIVQYLLLGVIVFTFRGVRLGIEGCAISSLLLGYGIGFLVTLLVMTLVKQTYLKMKREIKSFYQLMLISTLMLLVSTFLVTGDLTTAIYLGSITLYTLIIVVIYSSLSASIVNPMYLGVIGVSLMMPFFMSVISFLSEFISKTAFETSLSKYLFPSFAFLSLASLPGLLSEVLLSHRSVKLDGVNHLVKELLLTMFVSLITGSVLMNILSIVPSQHSTLITSSFSLSNRVVVTELTIIGGVMTTLFVLLRGLISRFVILTFFTNPLTIPAAIILLNSEDVIFILAIASLAKFIFTVSAYRYKEFKIIYHFFKNYIIPISSGILLAISILHIMK